MAGTRRTDAREWATANFEPPYADFQSSAPEAPLKSTKPFVRSLWSMDYTYGQLGTGDGARSGAHSHSELVCQTRLISPREPLWSLESSRARNGRYQTA